ncbi:MAG: serine/threonine-protein kinase, partial [Acidobacteria bacterium]|nr:serine/threonine-protein kinase [Acidobacteriota bacterium]
MPISTLSGTRLGPYQVHEQLGAGGMGEVYRATDTRLGRDVAVKVLPPTVAADPQQRSRLHREAQLISALDHPHVCVLHDVGQSEGIDYLVLELLKGHTLLDRLRKGPLPIAHVLHVGSQIADGLAAAHRHGVVHRDLKPANVMLTPTGVKVLDFGLAKPLAGHGSTAETRLGESPATAEGSLTGTLQYMAPEQVQGQPADTRSDIFALGAVLHEMVTGRKAFDGTNHASVIAKILDIDPPSVSALVPMASRGLDHVIQRCLAKAADDRWQSAHDVHLHLEWLRSPLAAGTPPAEPSAHRARHWLPWAVAAVFALAAVTLLLVRPVPRGTSPSPLRFRVLLEDARLQQFDVPELSPDGRRIAYAALRNGRRQLFVNDLRTEQTVVLPGTDGADFPFWAPDGRNLAFFADGSLKRVALTGGAAQVLAAARGGTGGAWKPGTILFAPSWQGAFQQLSDTGGTPSPIRADATTPGQGFLVTPSFLPDGVHFIAAMLGGPGVYIASLDAPQVRRLVDVDTLWARFAAGHLLYLQGRRLMARPLDPT